MTGSVSVAILDDIRLDRNPGHVINGAGEAVAQQ